MLYILSYLLFSSVIIGVIFYLINNSPSGWEDENGFHVIPVEHQKQHAFQKNKDMVRSGRLHTGHA